MLVCAPIARRSQSPRPHDRHQRPEIRKEDTGHKPRKARGRAAAACDRTRGGGSILPSRYALAGLFPDRAHRRGAGGHHPLRRLVVHQPCRCLGKAAYPQGLSARQLSALHRAWRWAHLWHCRLDGDRGAHRQSVRPQPGELWRDDARPHADRAQRLSHAEADIRDGPLQEWRLLQARWPDRVSPPRSPFDRVYCRRSAAGDRGEDRRCRPARHGVHAERPEPHHGLHSVRAGE